MEIRTLLAIALKIGRQGQNIAFAPKQRITPNAIDNTRFRANNPHWTVKLQLLIHQTKKDGKIAKSTIMKLSVSRILK